MGFAMTLAHIHAIWIGDALDVIGVTCLLSFLTRGHSVTLHAYHPPRNVPKGVTIEDANKLIPEREIVYHKQSGSVALFSDFLRYELLATHHGLYVDCDVYCIRPMEDADTIFGWEGDGCINNAVLALPSSSPTLEALRRLRRRSQFIPPWFARDRQFVYRVKRLFGRAKLTALPWGTTGPRALTWYAKQFGIADQAASIDTFYPVHWAHTSLLLDPDRTLADLVTPRTQLVHLWTSRLNKIAKGNIPPSSPVGRLIAASSVG